MGPLTHQGLHPQKLTPGPLPPPQSSRVGQAALSILEYVTIHEVSYRSAGMRGVPERVLRYKTWRTVDTKGGEEGSVADRGRAVVTQIPPLPPTLPRRTQSDPNPRPPPTSLLLLPPARQEFGNNPDTSKALRCLVTEGELQREGRGGRKDPFSYTVSLPRAPACGSTLGAAGSPPSALASLLQISPPLRSSLRIPGPPARTRARGGATTPAPHPARCAPAGRTRARMPAW